MAHTSKSFWESRDSLLYANAACLFLGVGMIFWGIAPDVVERLVTGKTPALNTLLLNSATFILGLAFIGMHVLLKRGIRWAAWAAFSTSAILASAGLALITSTGVQLVSSFLVLLSASTCFSSWLAIAALARQKTKAALQPISAKRKSSSRMFK